MSDTVSGAVIAASLDSEGLVFLPLAEGQTGAGAMHVDGGAHANAGSMGLLVEFRSLVPDPPVLAAAGPQPDLPATISGSVAFVPDHPDVVAGALQQTH